VQSRLCSFLNSAWQSFLRQVSDWLSVRSCETAIKKRWQEELALSGQPRQGWEENFVPRRVCQWLCAKAGDTASAVIHFIRSTSSKH
jgi:hypothetical protein